MSDDTQVREFLSRMADEASVTPVDHRFVVQRARRHRTVAMAAVAVVVVVSVTGSLVGLRALTQTRPEPAVQTPTPNTSPHRPLGLAIVGLDGTVQQGLGLPNDTWMPDLSSDGGKIMFLTESHRVGTCGGCVPNVVRLAAVSVGDSAGDFLSPHADVRVPQHVGRVDHLGDPEEMAFSPDGNRFAFVGVGRFGTDIFVGDLRDRLERLPDGLRYFYVRRLTFDPAVDEFPAWSPDGSTIFYDNAGAEPPDSDGFSPTQEIWSVPADGGGTPQQLTNNRVADTQPDVAADGTVAFWHDGDIWTMDVNGDNQNRLKAVPAGLGFNPRWSPDGTKMALLRYDPTERAVFDPSSEHPTDLPLLDVVVVDLSTGDVTVIGPRVAGDFNPVSWTPDGSGLLINRYDAGP